MNVEDYIMTDEKQRELCKIIFKILNCHLLWVMHTRKGLLNLLVTDSSIFEHYWDKKYYLNDPHILNVRNLSEKPLSSQWTTHLGSDSETFKESGFLYDLYKLFNIEEFVSFEKNLRSKSKTIEQSYCFRFFTRNNRFVFMNKLLNNMPFIRFFMHAMMKESKIGFGPQLGFNIFEPGKN